MSSPVVVPNLAQDLNIGNTFGALFIGAILAAILYGVTNLQVFIYLHTNRDRGMSLYKLAAIWLWMLDTMSMALIIHAMYYYLVTSYSNVSSLLYTIWSFQLQTVPSTLIVYGVHILYAYRIWIVSRGRSRVLPGIVGIFVIGTSGVGIVFIWEVYHVHKFTDAASLDWAVYLTLSTMAFNDFIIASSLCYFLATSRTGFSRTDSLLTKLIAYTINTGALTSVTSLISMISCALLQGTLIYLAVQLLLIRRMSKATSDELADQRPLQLEVYVISFLALINMRHHLRSEYSDTIDTRKFNIHRSVLPTAGSKKLDAETFEEPKEKLSQYSSQHDNELYPALPVPALKSWRLSTTTDMGSFSSV